MNQYKYILEKYKGLNSRFTCPSCGKHHQFTRYVDENGNHLADNIGVCNRADKCGYHQTPKQFFEMNKFYQPLKFEKKPAPIKPIFQIPISKVEDTLTNYPNNSFAMGLKNILGEATAVNLLEEYKCIGTSLKFAGGVIFWQITQTGKVYTAKIMKYDSNTLKRVKDFITWAHVGLINEETHQRKSCFFGENLLYRYPNKKIAITEAEKTAVICSHFMPEYNWMAAGNLNGLTAEKFEALRGKEVVLFPDLGKGTEVWEKKAEEFKNITRIKVSQYLKSIATPEDIENGADLADLLLR